MRSFKTSIAAFFAFAVLATPNLAPADGDAGSEPEAAPLDAEPFPAEATPLPKAEEWARAGRVKLTRTGAAAESCRGYRVREWLRVRCSMKTFALSLLGGNAQGLAFWIGAEKEGQPGEALFPMRPGDRRVIALWIPGTDAHGQFAPKQALVIQEQWIVGEKTPIVSAM
jgi:hypothetical protein